MICRFEGCNGGEVKQSALRIVVEWMTVFAVGSVDSSLLTSSRRLSNGPS